MSEDWFDAYFTSNILKGTDYFFTINRFESRPSYDTNLKTGGNCEHITEGDIIKTASNFGYWCANGKVAQSINNKLLK